MNQTLLAILILTVASSAQAKNCSSVLKQLTNPEAAKQISFLLNNLDNRHVASSEEKKNRKMTLAVKYFIENQPIAEQRALATLLTNFISDADNRKNRDLFVARDLIGHQVSPADVKATDPNNVIQKFISETNDIHALKNISIYILTTAEGRKMLGKEGRYPAKEVKGFLERVVKDDLVLKLKDECIDGDPRNKDLEKIN